MDPMQDSLLKRYIKITLVISLYWFVSIFMVFLNKSILGGASKGQNDAPIFITGFQCFVTIFLCLATSNFSKISPSLINFPHLGFPDIAKARKVLPLSIVFVSMITFNNLCLKYVGVAFYYVGRSLSTVFNVLFTYLLLGEKTSAKAITCCCILVAGFILGVDQEGIAGSLSLLGVLFGVAASAFVSLNAIVTKKVLSVVDGSIWELTYYNNILAVILFIPLIIVMGEVPAVMKILSDSSLGYWELLILSGGFGFAIGFVSSLQIKVTSPLTHTISGTAKACCQTVIATWWYTEHKPFFWWISNWVVLGSSLAYTRVKQLEMKTEHNARSNIENSAILKEIQRNPHRSETPPLKQKNPLNETI